jgi:hypothetical protein
MAAAPSADELIAHALASLDLAERGSSRLTAEVLGIEGMSGAKTRHLYNNLCNLPGCRYLEIGSWKGSSTVAALFGNDASGTAVDNFSQFGGPVGEFRDNVQRFLRPGQVELVNADAWEYLQSEAAAALAGRRPVVYVYDGSHAYEDQRLAIVRAAPHLARVAVVVVDDWNWDDVRRGTADGIADAGARVLWSREIRSPAHGDAAGFWNGVGLFVLDLGAP